MKNIWILSEERPKTRVIEKILCDILRYNIVNKEQIKIVPICKEQCFSFTYEVKGITIVGFEKIYIRIVKGESSFVDYMIFEKGEEPNQNDRPIILIEETKTDDTESRNVHAFQRNSKFVYGDMCYPNIRKVMLYTDELSHVQTHPTTTNIFGTDILLTLNVEVFGKNIDEKIYKKFESIEELIEKKNSMPETVNGQSIKLRKEGEKIYISAKLDKRKWRW
jgi:hypothetical protein